MATLDGKVAIVTGAAGDIGREITRAFVKAGATVNACDVESKRLESLCEELSESPGKVVPYVTDISDLSAINAMVDSVAKKFKTVHVLINGAAICPLTSIEEIEESEWDKTLSINLKAPFFVTKAVVPLMKTSKRGRIINISSISRHGNMGQTNYTATKAGVEAMAVTWAKELARYGIRATSIAPGYIGTEMVMSMKPEALDKIAAGIPAKRLGKPEEIARTVTFILENDYVNGRCIEVDGALRI